MAHQISLISLSNSDWNFPYWTSRQFLTYELASHARVVYATERPQIRQFLKSVTTFFVPRPRAPFAAPPGLEVLEPLWPKTYRYAAADRALFKRYIRRLQRKLDQCARAQRVVYAWHPNSLDSVKALTYEFLVYHPYDMFREFTSADKSAGDELVNRETELCNLADALVTPHRSVADILNHPNTHVINNGVFLPAFPYRRPGPTKERNAIGDNPLIGYVGTINDKVDFALLFQIFSGRQDWRLILVGPEGPGTWKTSEGFRNLAALPNVGFMPGVPINKLAPIIATFDIGIVPYSLTGWARYSESPLKLYQYWAMGVPVVCSPLPNIQAKENAIAICRSANEWQDAITQVLASKVVGTGGSLRELAERHSWGARARDIIEVIRHLN